MRECRTLEDRLMHFVVLMGEWYQAVAPAGGVLTRARSKPVVSKNSNDGAAVE